MAKGTLLFSLLCIYISSFLILGFVGVCVANIKFVCQVGTDAWMDLHIWEFIAGIIHLLIFMFGIIPLILIRTTTSIKILSDDNGPPIIIYMITSCFINFVWAVLGSFNLWFFNTAACQTGSYKLWIVSYVMVINSFCIFLFPAALYILHKFVK